MAEAKKKPRAKPKDPDTLTIYGKPDGDPTKEIAQAYLRPTVQAGSTVRTFNKGKDGSGPILDALVAELQTQVGLVADGDLSRAEAMLVSQAHALDAMFGYLARRAVKQEYLAQYETHMRLALKAQAQCARTLEVLGNLKNPAPVAFVRQANIGNAVQVNNGQPSRAQDRIPNQSNELLRAENGERLELGAQDAASDSNPSLATVDTLNRTQDGNR